jgi:type III secretory pathway component EscS
VTGLLLVIAGVLGLMAGWTLMPLIAFAATAIALAGRVGMTR